MLWGCWKKELTRNSFNPSEREQSWTCLALCLPRSETMPEWVSAAQLLLSSLVAQLCILISELILFQTKNEQGLEQENSSVKSGGAQRAHTNTLIFTGILIYHTALSQTPPQFYLLSKHIQPVSSPLQKIFYRSPWPCKLTPRSVTSLGILPSHHQCLKKIGGNYFPWSHNAHASPDCRSCLFKVEK